MRNPGVKVTAGKPMVAYRQTLSKPVEIETRYIKQSGGRGKFAVIYMQVRAADQGAGRGVDDLPGGAGREAGPEQHLLHGQDRRRRGARRVHPVGGAGLPRGDASRGPSTASSAWTCSARCSTASTTTWTARRTRSSWRRWSVRATRMVKAGITLLEPIMNVVVHGPGAVPGRPDRRHQPPPRRDPELQLATRAAARSTPTSRWRRCSATPATCATPPAARRRSAWSRATTPRSSEELADLRQAS